MALTVPPSPVPEVPIEEQFIVGFGQTAFTDDANAARQRVDTALSTLLDSLPGTLLQKYVGTAQNKAYFAIAVIRLDGPDRTLEYLQQEVESGKSLGKPGYAYIAWVEPNAPVGLTQQQPFNDPLAVQQWALPKLGVTGPWTVVPPAGQDIIVAIVDSGLRLPGGGLHADLDALRVVPVADAQPPFFFADNVDRDGHGTLLAGTIAAVSNNNIGVASAASPGWNITLMPVKFFDPPGRPTAADAVIAIAHAALHFFNGVGNPVKVINVSWHVPAGDAGVIALWAVTVLASFVGCLVVFAAGNDGTDNGIYPLFPANLRNAFPLQGQVLSVLATDSRDAKASFSNYGQNEVDIGAPGIHILSTESYFVPPPRYSYYSGTSAAAAYVSAGAALVFALNPAWPPAAVVQHLTASADIIPQLVIACANGQRLNLARAVYGPLQVLAPAAGAVLQIGVLSNINWAVNYNNPAFVQVNIDFVTDPGGAVFAIGPAAPIAPPFAWVPAVLQLPPLPAVGRIRITPVGGNFPAYSGVIQVIA